MSTNKTSELLFDLLKKNIKKRNDEADAVDSKEAFLERQQMLRKEFEKKVLKKAKHNHNPGISSSGTISCEGYSIEKLIITPEPDYHIPVNVYVPDNKPGKSPAVLMLIGHNNEGKSFVNYQKFCANLALMGFISIIPEPWGQGERSLYTTADGQIMNCVIQHSMIGNLCYLLGTNINIFYTQDTVYTLDYLCSRQDVDINRIGCTGQSGGGTSTAFLASLDERIAVAAPMHSMSTYIEMLTDLGQSGDPDQSVYGLVSGDFDMPDLVWMAAPRPYLINAATRDFFPIRGNRKIFEQAKGYYRYFDAEERLALKEVDSAHEITQQAREITYRWMGKWLLGKDENFCEKSVEIKSDEELSCFDENMPKNSLTPFDICRKMLKEQKKNHSHEAFLEFMKKTRDYENEPAEYIIHKGGERLVVFIDPEQCITDDEYISKIRSEGFDIACLHPTGIEYSASKETADMEIYSKDHMYAYYSFILGHSLLFKRLGECIGALRELGGKDIILAGSGQGAVISLLTAAIYPGISGLILSDFTPTYEEFFKDKDYSMAPSGILFGMLGYFDLDIVLKAVSHITVKLMDLKDHKNNIIRNITQNKKEQVYNYILEMGGLK